MSAKRRILVLLLSLKEINMPIFYFIGLYQIDINSFCIFRYFNINWNQIPLPLHVQSLLLDSFHLHEPLDDSSSWSRRHHRNSKNSQNYRGLPLRFSFSLFNRHRFVNLFFSLKNQSSFRWTLQSFLLHWFLPQVFW